MSCCLPPGAEPLIALPPCQRCGTKSLPLSPACLYCRPVPRALAEMAELAITEPSKAGVKLLVDKVDIAYPPVFQSGGRYL